MTTTETTLAQRQAAGLRALADLLDEWPGLAGHIRVPLDGLCRHVFEDAQPVFAEFIRAAQKHGAKIRKEYHGDAYAHVYADFDGITVGLQTDREQVCERVVVGTREVQVPDPAAPKVTVTEDVVEWECRPILAAAESTSGGAR